MDGCGWGKWMGGGGGEWMGVGGVSGCVWGG